MAIEKSSEHYHNSGRKFLLQIVHVALKWLVQFKNAGQFWDRMNGYQDIRFYNANIQSHRPCDEEFRITPE